VNNKLTVDQFIEKARLIHGDRYDYSLVEYKNSRTKVKIICPIHGVFEQIPNNHINAGRGCNQCGIEKTANDKRLPVDQFIQKAREVHGDRYDYSLVEYKNNTTRIKIICPVHGIFEQKPSNHLDGHGCRKCSSFYTTDQFIEKAKEVHGDRYDYSLVEYKDSQTKVKIICPIHGVFKITPAKHLFNKGCPKCSREEMSKRMSDDSTVFIQKAREVHGDRYDYSLVEYKDSKIKVKIICSIHGVFEQIPNNHTQGQHCPKCNGGTSIQEQNIQNWLSDYINIETNNKSVISPYELDIVIPSKKIAIEYNGLYWHSEQQGKNQTYHLNKHQLCEEAGYRLIQIWENEWAQKKDIVKSIILSAIGMYERKIGARQCKVEDIDSITARQFYDNNHIQGFHGGKHKGLLHKGELVSMMTIDITNNIQRFVNKINYQVIGAFSKLLKSFNINDTITTFSDLRYFTGDVYRKNGFMLKYITKPNYYYHRRNEFYSRVSFQKHKLKDKLEVFDPNLTEYQNMLNNGYDRIWDCGHMKFKKELICE